jgi:hypothetical protein
MAVKEATALAMVLVAAPQVGVVLVDILVMAAQGLTEM